MKRTFEAVKSDISGAWEVCKEACDRATGPLVKAGSAITGVLISGAALADPAAPVATPALLLAGIDFAQVTSAVLGIIAAAIVFFIAKGSGIQIVSSVRRFLGA